jgi:hypothetical protein
MAPTPPDQGGTSPSIAALGIPLLLSLLFGGMIFVPTVRAVPNLVLSFLGTAAILLLWAMALAGLSMARKRRLHITLAIRTPHYIQMIAQGIVLAWWGWFVPSVYAYAPLILAQILVAYAVDMLLNWSRREEYRLGVGPVPVVFSINLFLWFHLEWFFFQFAMVALVFFGKEFLRWNREGRNTHIFNPSAFALSVAAAILIVTQSSHITFGEAIATTQYNPPWIYAVIFLAALPGQILFGVATMTASAMVTVWAFSAVFFATTGTYFFYDAYIPIAVFLGMHLLFTDPATSPRSEVGRILFGIFYGAGVVLSAVGLEMIGEPTYWDKLLPVPILNLLVMRIDSLANAVRTRIPPALDLIKGMSPRREYATTAGIWTGIFILLYASGGVGDNHPGQYLPFWQEACEEGSSSGRGCDRLGFMQFNFCERGSSWACNELGIWRVEHDQDNPRNRDMAGQDFALSCEMGFEPGCQNGNVIMSGTNQWFREPPPDSELPVVLRGSKGPVTEADPEALRALGCERGWTEMCGS